MRAAAVRRVVDSHGATRGPKVGAEAMNRTCRAVELAVRLDASVCLS